MGHRGAHAGPGRPSHVRGAAGGGAAARHGGVHDHVGEAEPDGGAHWALLSLCGMRSIVLKL